MTQAQIPIYRFQPYASANDVFFILKRVNDIFFIVYMFVYLIIFS